MHKNDRQASLVRWLVPIGLIAFCGVVIVVTTTFERMPPILKRGIQPSDFPQLVAGLIIALTLLSIWREPVRLTARVGARTWGTLLLLALFAALMALDLFLALGLFAVGLSALWGERRLPVFGLVGLAVPFAIFLLFDLVFDIRFPRGVLTNLWYG